MYQCGIFLKSLHVVYFSRVYMYLYDIFGYFSIVYMHQCDIFGYLISKEFT